LKKITFITSPDAEYGFSLTGINQYTGEAHEAEDMIKKAIADPETGLVVIDERLVKGVGEERVREIERGWDGILLVLPSPQRAPAEVEDYVARLIRRAIGYHVRLKV
jgi:vacuolar-type H+-ATPase subunit F/Vma7